jgi:cold shock CspA family protein
VGSHNGHASASPRLALRRRTGTVIRFDVLLGSGMIGQADGEAVCSFRHIALRGTTLGILMRGDRVEFDLIEGRQGPNAQDLVRVSA